MPLQSPAQSPAGAERTGGPAQTPLRSSNPAVRSTGGESGFDGGARTRGGGGFQVAGGLPSLNPSAQPQTGSRFGGVTGSRATGGVGEISDRRLDALFNRASKTYEHILTKLGATFSQVDDPTQRLNDRSTQLGNLLTANPQLKDQISTGDKRRVSNLSRMFLAIQPQLSGDRLNSANAFLGTAAMFCAEWPPPPRK